MFLEEEKRRYAVGKPTFRWLSPDAKAPGRYRGGGRLYDFCIPAEHAAENLFEGIRTSMLQYFQANGIAWHHGIEEGPNNHLASSMVCGVNFLGPLMDHPAGATALLRRAFGEDVVEAVPVASSRLVEFEWVGDPDTDYLHEGLRRTRGANATSADAAMAYRRPDGAKTLVLVEWKYTESYAGADKGVGKGAGTRQQRYAPLVGDPAGPIDTSPQVVVHRPRRHTCPKLHAVPQAPQSRGSAVTSVHTSASTTGPPPSPASTAASTRAARMRPIPY